MNGYPDGQLYETLYAKYIHKRDVGELIDDARMDLHGKRVLDLCCGTGRLTKECVARGATVTSVDASAGMTNGLRTWMRDNAPTSSLSVCSVEECVGASLLDKVLFDVVFCRQAVNYWMYDDLMGDFAEIIAPGGKFVFNTFTNEPSQIPVVKEYDYDGSRFVEVGWRESDIVRHVQIRQGFPPHVTDFRWIPPAKFLQMLTPHFDVCVTVKDRTSIYICTKGKST
jgi:SAM-dependent methyltransferase